ncbi:sensor histidine kinase [Alishewanella agri BL06]|uniref:histidine kinase n=1 Tax=Alishewanella agri BL06 TaxID=1195246 RepID=I8U421_9ALTE|nr:ATP-binding protein [Alishewanella agri]EIW88081.1 sensor histidine kinase [Alishewanella agri BL06]
MADQDIRVLKQQLAELTEQLVRSEKLASIGQLAAGVAHEINNPIGYVASNLAVLKDYTNSLTLLVQRLSEQLPPAQSQLLKSQFDFDYICEDLPNLLQQSEQGLQRVIEIIRDLKDFSHIDQAEFVMADLQQGILSTLNIVANEIKYKAEVVKQFAELPPVFCIPSQLNQVLLNLLVNAAQAIVDRGIITISTGCDAQWVWFSVADTGPGIAAEQLEQIFQPFYTTKPKGQGTGLGLALSRSIVEKHKGLLEVQSTPGVGSCFTVKIPRTVTSP